MKLGVEGPLFLYQRSCAPFHGYLILNRLTPKNFFGLITESQSLMRSDSFLIYREDLSSIPPISVPANTIPSVICFLVDEIFGLWFFKREEQDRIGNLWDSVVRDLSAQPEPEVLYGLFLNINYAILTYCLFL